MQYKYYEREYEQFEDFEVSFFQRSDSMFPFKIFHSTTFDRSCRNSESMSIERNDLERGGCYLYFDSYQNAFHKEIVPLYVGKSDRLFRRLSAHWGKVKNFVNEDQDAWLRNDLELRKYAQAYLDSGQEYAMPEGTLWVSCWHQDNERERLFLEHELIYKFRPLYNKA